MKKLLTRRQWLRQVSTAWMGAMLAPRVGSGSVSRPGIPRQHSGDMPIYFGDLHNHNNVGYAQGSMERAFAIARSHLDFYAFTPHAHWHDMGEYEGNIENKWINGFAVTRGRWSDVVTLNQQYEKPGAFVTIPGYEWHSTHKGDVHVLLPDLQVTADDLFLPETLQELQTFARNRGALLVPHHPANRLGHRGANFAERDPEVSPVLEMYSEWGNAEHDRAPYPYIRHTEGGRWTQNTVQYLLNQGHRFGLIASTDDHLGYPGAYREGLVAVMAPELSREAIFRALRSRRCYAVTGDRIGVNFTLNDQPMGSALPFARQRHLQVEVTGWDQIDRVEVVKNTRVIHRDFPVDRVPDRSSWDAPVLVRFEYGWGPWPALGMGRTADWDVTLQVEGGMIEEAHPCFQAGPLDEERRDRILHQTDREVRFESFTALRQMYEDRSQKSVVLKLQGTPETTLSISTAAPTSRSLQLNARQLTESNEMLFTGPFPRESAMVHRLVFHEQATTRFELTDTGSSDREDWYYIRVIQSNGQLAWSSPIWVNKA